MTFSFGNGPPYTSSEGSPFFNPPPTAFRNSSSAFGNGQTQTVFGNFTTFGASAAANTNQSAFGNANATATERNERDLSHFNSNVSIETPQTAIKTMIENQPHTHYNSLQRVANVLFATVVTVEKKGHNFRPVGTGSAKIV